jgi:hypothetical protein
MWAGNTFCCKKNKLQRGIAPNHNTTRTQIASTDASAGMVFLRLTLHLLSAPIGPTKTPYQADSTAARGKTSETIKQKTARVRTRRAHYRTVASSQQLMSLDSETDPVVSERVSAPGEKLYTLCCRRPTEPENADRTRTSFKTPST